MGPAKGRGGGRDDLVVGHVAELLRHDPAVRGRVDELAEALAIRRCRRSGGTSASASSVAITGEP